MKKSLMICLMVGALVCAFALPSVIAGNAPAANMILKAPEGTKMTKAPVAFPHKLHEDSGIACLTCHHEAKTNEEIQSCSAEGCHTNTDKKAKKDPKGFYAAWHSKKSEISCMGCHRKEKKAGKTNVPVACKDCHPKKTK